MPPNLRCVVAQGLKWIRNFPSSTGIGESKGAGGLTRSGLAYRGCALLLGYCLGEILRKHEAKKRAKTVRKVKKLEKRVAELKKAR